VTLPRAVELLKRCADELLEHPDDLDVWDRFVEAFQLVMRMHGA